MSRAKVAEAYSEIQRAERGSIAPPFGPLDFHGGNAELLIGGITYNPTVLTIVRYYGEDIITVCPGSAGNPGKISAIFTDESGREVMRLDQNVWRGALDAWDIQVVGSRLTVRRAARQIVLDLTLEPPGRIVIDHLDMRLGDCHLLVSRRAYAIGRFVDEDNVFWMYAEVGILRGSPVGAAIEFASPSILQDRFEHQKTHGQYMATPPPIFVVGNETGVMMAEAGMAIATLCGAITFKRCGHGVRPLSAARHAVFETPEQIGDLFMARPTGV